MQGERDDQTARPHASNRIVTRAAGQIRRAELEVLIVTELAQRRAMT